MKTVLALMTALAPWPALAHSLWIEPAADGTLRARYGEPEIRVLERSPGPLDALLALRAQTHRSAELSVRAVADGFLLGAAEANSDALVEAQGATNGMRYHARHAVWPLKAAQPAMALDIVPTGQAGTFVVFFHGAPLARGTLKVIAPSLWLQVHDIDGRGQVRIHTPWRGLYVLDVELRDSPAGKTAGPDSEPLHHRATLSFTTPEGALFERPLPAQFTEH